MRDSTLHVTRTRYATSADTPFVSQDGYISAAIIARKIAAQEVVMAERDGVPVGYARIEYLWSKVPYLALIRVVPNARRQGIGRAILTYLTKELLAAGHSALFSSSQADEPDPQAWHRHMGFVECGHLTGINAGGVDEIFFRKDLGPDPASR